MTKLTSLQKYYWPWCHCGLRIKRETTDQYDIQVLTWKVTGLPWVCHNLRRLAKKKNLGTRQMFGTKAIITYKCSVQENSRFTPQKGFKFNTFNVCPRINIHLHLHSFTWGQGGSGSALGPKTVNKCMSLRTKLWRISFINFVFIPQSPLTERSIVLGRILIISKLEGWGGRVLGNNLLCGGRYNCIDILKCYSPRIKIKANAWLLLTKDGQLWYLIY